MGTSGIKVLKSSVLALVALLPVSCGQVTVQPTAVNGQGGEDALGTLSLTNEAFPEGAERLMLSLTRADIHVPCWVAKTATTSVPVTVSEGLGLSQSSDSVHCTPPHFKKPSALDIARKPNFAWEKIIEIKKGDVIAPIQLRAGTYYARANFYNASSMLLYRGDEKFTLATGEQKSLRIRLKKVDSGEITVGFEVEKPEVRPTRISGDSHLELRKTPGFAVSRGHYEKTIDLDLANGVAVTSTKCPATFRGVCTSEVLSRKVNLTKTAIKKIVSITDSVALKDGRRDQVCLDPLEYIALVLKKCKECEVGKEYEFSNIGCNTPTHSLSSQQFDEIWTAIHGLNVRADTVAANP